MLGSDEGAADRVRVLLQGACERSDAVGGELGGAAAGVDRLYFNFMYALVTETGEFHSPKDDDRRELALSPALVRSVREQTLTDAMAMHRAGVVLAPNFLRAMGLEQEAMQRESIIWRQQDTTPPPKKGKRISRQPKWNVEAILDQ